MSRVRSYGIKRTFYYSYCEARRLLRVCLSGSYSQMKEDLVIDRLLGGRTSGFYVDVGAWHPRKFNNTWRFYKRGWRGINIEPDPEMFQILAVARPRDINLNVAVGSREETLELFRFDSGNLSTLSRAEAKACLEKGFVPSDTTKVEVRTLAGLLAEHCPSHQIDFMSIDTEGLELEVLKGNDWSRFRPRLICIETAEAYRSEGSKCDAIAIKELLGGLGYREVHRNLINSIFALEKPGQDGTP